MTAPRFKCFTPTMSDSVKNRRHLHFITGRLAEHSLRCTVEEVAKTQGFSYSIGVAPITVAALMTPRWLLRHFEIPASATEVILPGFIGEAIDSLRAATTAEVRIGPKDLRDLPEFLGAKKSLPIDLSNYEIEIIAEINHAPRLSLEELVTIAQQLRADGADVIDLGCQPGQQWEQVGEAVGELVSLGLRVSIDSFDPQEVAAACRRGAELVLSVNSSNAAFAKAWETEVVAIPDTPQDIPSLLRTIEILSRDKVPFRIDPILEPIGCGCAESLVRYHSLRQQFPEVEMMMGIGNLTELTDVDSAGINVLLLGICAELRVHSVLTTQVINWARTSVRECDRARRLVHYAAQRGTPPKRLDDALVMLRDPRLKPHPPGTFDQLATTIRDNNYRLFAEQGALHLVSAGLHLQGPDPFAVFDELLAREQSANVDVSHAFYLGFEMAKALTALQLGKQYNQDQALQWGHLTQPENMHRLRRGRKQTG